MQQRGPFIVSHAAAAVTPCFVAMALSTPARPASASAAAAAASTRQRQHAQVLCNQATGGAHRDHLEESGEVFRNLLELGPLLRVPRPAPADQRCQQTLIRCRVGVAHTRVRTHRGGWRSGPGRRQRIRLCPPASPGGGRWCRSRSSAALPPPASPPDRRAAAGNRVSVNRIRPRAGRGKEGKEARLGRAWKR